MFIRKDSEGKRYLFPYGKLTKGYFIEEDKQFTEAEVLVIGMWILLIGSFAFGFDLQTFKFSLIYVCVFIPTILLVPLTVIFKLKKANIEWAQTTSYTKPNRPMTRKQILQGLAYGLVLFFVLCSWFIYREKHFQLAELFFFGITFYGMYKLLIRLWTGDYTDKME